jgi:hypothetical protein
MFKDERKAGKKKRSFEFDNESPVKYIISYGNVIMKLVIYYWALSISYIS